MHVAILLLLLVYCSNDVSRAHYQAISEQPGIDIWRSTNGGSSLDIRITRGDVTWLVQKLGLHCTTIHDSVEELVRKSEESIGDNVKQEWFEEYVS